ncbi:hypothetical protein ACAW74_00965 [Fibrella sp. WM1]|uniref:hypothetical protein n=1 Tax=Fibrella musci TaxID=3242485 RepID=UPI003521C83D
MEHIVMKVNFCIIALFIVGSFAISTSSIAQSTQASSREDNALQAQISNDIRSLETEIRKINTIDALKIAAQKKADQLLDEQLLHETDLLAPKPVNTSLLPASSRSKPVKTPVKTERHPRTT